ncbi:MAG: AAA family ATPase [Brevinematia bacterium]
MSVFLRKIELFGFKSFADRSKIEFNSPITAIVGPNGSGKSNIVDAIRWVLGENSAKVLRGDTFEDILFSGSQYRPSISVAEVSLLFDNSKRILQIPVDEVEITKRYYRSGEGKILLNKQEARVKDIVNLFLGTGFGKDGYSIVGQGEVDKLVIGSPLEKRVYVDELLGITKVKFKKKEAEKRLQDINYTISTISVRLESIEKDYLRLKDQVQKLKSYRELTEKLEFFEKVFFKLKLESLKKEVDYLKREKESLNNRIQEINSKINELSSYMKEADLELQSNNNLLSKKRDGLNELERLIKSKEIEKKDFESKISISKRTIEIFCSSLDKEVKRKEDLFREKENLYKNLRELEEDFSIISSQISELDSELKSLEGVKRELENKKRDLLLKLNVVNELINKLNDIKREMEFIEVKKRELEESRVQLFREIERFRLEIEENDKRKIEIVSSLNLIKDEKSKKLLELEEESSSIKQLEMSIVELQKIVNNLTKESEKIFSEFSKEISDSAIKVGEFVSKVGIASERILKICDSIISNDNFSFVFESINEIKTLVSDVYNDLKSLPFLSAATDFITRKMELDEKIVRFRNQIEEMYSVLNAKKENFLKIKDSMKDLESLIASKEKDLFYYEQKVDEILKQIKLKDNLLSRIDSEIKDLDSKYKNLELSLERIFSKVREHFNINVSDVNSALNFLDSLKKDKKIEEIDKEISEIDSNISLKRSKLVDLNTSFTVMSSNKEYSHFRILKIDEEISNIDAYSLRKKEEIESEKKNISTYEEKLKLLKDDLDSLYRDRDQVLKVVSELSYNVKVLNDNYRKLLSERESLTNEVGTFEKESFKLEEKIITLENSILDLESQLKEKYGITYEDLTGFSNEYTDLGLVGKKINEIKNEIKKLGFIDEGAEDEFLKVGEEYEKLKNNLDDILQSKQKLENMIGEINKEIENIIESSINDISRIITDVFKEIFGGGGVKVEIVNNDLVEGGIELIVNIPGKKVRNLMLLSGGEKALVGIIFIFSSLIINNTPVVIMDEVDAPLDDENTERFKRLLLAFQDKTQFIIISHNKSTIEMCHDIYGVTMEEKGVSKVVSYRLQDVVSS